MKWILTGLGNPGNEYIGTRHNVGRDVLDALKEKIPDNLTLVVPNVYMNDSGKAFVKMIKSKKQAEQLVVVHDDLDLPLGRVKLSFGSGAGGHRGVESIQKTLKTKDFVRIRVGVSPHTPGGKLKKVPADDVVDFVLGTFKPTEREELKKVQKIVARALELLIEHGRDHATMEIHTKH